MLRPYKENLNFGQFAAFQGRGYCRVHQQFREMPGGVIHLIDALANQLVVATGDGFAQGSDACFNFSAFIGGQAGGLRIGERFGSSRQDRFRFGARFDQLPLGKILLGVFDGFLEHALDFRIVDAITGLDFDGVLLAVTQILGADLQDAVGVNQELHFDAREAGGRGRHLQSESRQRATVFRQLAFALKNVDFDAGLIVDAGGVKLLRARGDRGIARNNFGDGAAIGLNAERKRRDVEQEHGFHTAVENVGLNGGAERDDFVRIQFDMRLASEEFLHRAADEWRARGAADEYDFIHVRGLELGVGQRLLDGAHGAVDHGTNEGIERAAREFVREQVAIRQCETKSGRFGFGEAVLHVDESFAQFLHKLAMRRKINFIMLENQLVNKGLQQIIDVVATEVRVAVGRKDLKDVAVGGGNELEDRNVEGAAAKVVDGDFAALFLVEAVGERGRGRLVDETEHFKAGDFAGVLGGLALGVIEVSRDGDYGAIDGIAEIGFGPVFQFAKDESGNFGRRENFAAEFYANDVLARWIDAKREQFQFIPNVSRTATHETFDGINRAFGLGKEAATRGFANDNAAIGIEADYRGAKGTAIWPRDTPRLVRLRIKICDETVGCTEIDSYDSTHDENREGLKPLRYKSSF